MALPTPKKPGDLISRMNMGDKSMFKKKKKHMKKEEPMKEKKHKDGTHCKGMHCKHGSHGKTHEKNWIAKAVSKNPGALHRELGVKAGKKIPAGKLAKAAKAGGKEGKRANLAKTLASFHKHK